MFGPPAGDDSSSSGGTDGSKQWEERVNCNFYSRYRMDGSIAKEIGYDSVRPWIARHVVSYLGEADSVDFMLAGGVCVRNGVIARGGMSVVVRLWCK